MAGAWGSRRGMIKFGAEVGLGCRLGARNAECMVEDECLGFML